MFSAIDWLLNKLAAFFSDWLTMLIRFILDFFRIKSDILQSDHYRGAVNFFFYDTMKILLMLTVIIFIVSIIRSYFPPERTKKLLGEGKARGLLGNIMAALLGIVTPFCSCSAVPVFIGFLEAGVPLGVTFSFLISSPMVNEVALIMLWGLFGWKIALLYIATGVAVAIIGGFVIGALKMERYVEEYVYKIKMNDIEMAKPGWKERISGAMDYVADILKKIWPYLIIGIAIGGIMHGWAPTGWLAQYVGKNNPFAVLLAVIVGIPLYSNAAGTIPIVNELVRLGIPMGTALAFMMSITAISFPELIILRKVLKPRLLLVFIGIITFTIVVIGYLFNWILK